MTNLLLCFSNNLLDDVHFAISMLPHELVPNAFSIDELGKRKKLSANDLAGRKGDIKQAKGGYFLQADTANYYLILRKGVSEFNIECHDDQGAAIIMEALAKLPIQYGYASQAEERDHQNSIVVEKNYGSHKAGVGRNYNKYLPGLYWMNIIPITLLKAHQIAIESISDMAKSVEVIDERNLLIKLYDNSKNWNQHSKTVDRWREETHGVFFKKEVKEKLVAAENFLEFMEATSEWE